MRNPTYTDPETGEVIYVGSIRALELIQDFAEAAKKNSKNARIYAAIVILNAIFWCGYIVGKAWLFIENRMGWL